MSLPALAITAQLAREPMPVTGERQIAYVLLDVQTPAPEQPNPVNLGLVLDRSGSMRGPRLQYLKAAIIQLIDQLGPEDVLSVVTFDDMVDQVIAAQLVEAPAELKAKVDLITDGGGTAMSLGLSLGLAELRTFASTERVNQMILVTDGVTHGDEDRCLDLADEAHALHIPIVPLGMGAEWDDAFLDRLAARSGGPPSDYIRTPAEIGINFARHLRALRSVGARGAALTARFVAGVVPRKVTRVSPALVPIDESIDGMEVACFLGDITHDHPQRTLIELLIEPKRGGTFRIAQVEGTHQGADGTPAVVRADVVVTFSGSASKPPQVRPSVVQYVERANAARVVLRAIDAVGAGPVSIAAPIAALFDGESREALEYLRAGMALSPEGRKALLARVRDLGRGTRIPV